MCLSFDACLFCRRSEDCSLSSCKPHNSRYKDWSLDVRKKNFHHLSDCKHWHLLVVDLFLSLLFEIYRIRYSLSIPSRIYWWQLWTGSVLADHQKYLLRLIPVGLETGSVSGFDRGLMLGFYVSVLKLIVCRAWHWLQWPILWHDDDVSHDRCDLSQCFRGARLLSEPGLFMDPVHSAGSVVCLVFWGSVAVCFWWFCFWFVGLFAVLFAFWLWWFSFSVQDFHCLNLLHVFHLILFVALVQLFALLSICRYATAIPLSRAPEEKKSTDASEMMYRDRSLFCLFGGCFWLFCVRLFYLFWSLLSELDLTFSPHVALPTEWCTWPELKKKKTPFHAT